MMQGATTKGLKNEMQLPFKKKHMVLRINIMSSFCVGLQVDGLFKWEACNCIESLCIESSAQIQMTSQVFCNLSFNEHHY
jgi:hypothetical protein